MMDLSRSSGDTSNSISDSDSEKNSLSNYLPTSASSNSRAKRLTEDLKDTTDTLHDVDRMLAEFNSVARHQAKSIDKLKNRMSRDSRQTRHSSSSSLANSDLESMRGRKSYRTTSPLRDYQYGSDLDHRSKSRRRPRSAVRFREDIRVDKDHLHDLHRSLRDLSADHERLESELEREIRNRYRHERDHERSLRDLNSSMRHQQSTSSVPRVSSIDNIEKRLERKLENIATKLERKAQPSGQGQSSDAQPLTAASLSKSLTEALHATQRQGTTSSLPQSYHGESQIHQQRIADLETDKRRLQNEMDSLRQKYEQSEGAKRAMSSQLEDIRSKFREMEDERHRAIRLAEDYRDAEKKSRKKQREVTRASEDENQRLQMEIQDLRVQLNHSVSREEVEVMRRELQKTEKQRSQLADHIENLTRDIKHSEEVGNSAKREINELTSNKAKMESDLQELRSELDKTRNNLKDLTSQLEKTNQELSATQSELSSANRNREEVRTKATEAVKQWKARCKNLQHELEDYKQYNSEYENKNQQLSRDYDTLRNQLMNSSNQVDRMAQEMADMLTAKQDLEEKARKLELEIKDLRRAKTELEHSFHEQSLSTQKLEREVRRANDQFINYEAESAQLTDKLSAAKDQLENLDDELRQLKSEYSNLQLELNKRNQVISDKDSNIQDLEARLLTTEASESACKRELDSIQVKLNRALDTHERTTADLLEKLDKAKRENTEVKARELKTAEEYHRKFKHIQADKDTEIEAMRLDLDNAHAAVQSIKRQAKQQSEEYIILEQKYKQVEDEFERHSQQYKKLKEKYDDLKEANEQHQQRGKESTRDLSASRKELTKLEKQKESLSQLVRAELLSLCDLIGFDNTEQMKTGDITSDVTAATALLKRYIRSAQDQERQLRTELKTRLNQEETEKRELIAEIKRTQTSMDDLSEKHRELIEDVVERDNEVARLKDRVEELSYQVDEQIAVDDMMERNRILDRYQRLQSAVNALKHELNNQSKISQSLLEDYTNMHSSSRPPSRQVRISEVVNNDDGTQSSLKPPPQESFDGASDRAERVQAYSKALGPNSYRDSSNNPEIEEVQGHYINDVVNYHAQQANADSHLKLATDSKSGSFIPTYRKHSTPKKTSRNSSES